MESLRQIPHSEKLQIAEEGKKLDPLEVEISAIRKYGNRKHRKHLAEHFDVTHALVGMAFNGKSPFLLFKINEFLINNINGEDQVVNSPKRTN
jgi:hypothetical protein